MKTLALTIITLGAASLAANAFVTMTFDSATSADTQSWRADFGDPDSTVSWTVTENAGGGAPGSGALQLNMDLNNNSAAFTSDWFSSPGTDVSSSPTISFDLKVDLSSTDDTFNQNGFLDFVIRNTDSYVWTPQLSGNVDKDNGWVNFSGPLSGSVDQVRAFTLQLYGGASQNITGPVTLYLDNVTIASPVPEPSSAIMSLLGVALLAHRRR